MFEPFYENYGPDAFLAGGRPRVVPLDPPEWRLDPERLAAAVGPDTAAIVLTTPHNPTGRVFSRQELLAVAELAVARDLLVFTDEVYDHIVHDDRDHVSMALLPGMRERTVTVSAMSKTYSVTGWRVGWAIAHPRLMASIRKVHDFLTVAAPAPLQEASVTALQFGPPYYVNLARSYQARRDVFLEATGRAGWRLSVPEGAYYALADIGPLRARLGLPDDTAFCRELVLRVGVAAVPGSSFFADPSRGRDLIRFAFPKEPATLCEAGSRLARLA